MGVISGVWKPTANGAGKKLADACEVTNLKLATGAGAAVVSIYDSQDSATDLKWVLDASTTDVDSQSFDGLVFKKGVYAVLDQGGGFTPVVCIARKHYEV